MKILILEDEPRSAKRLIRMLKDIDPMFVPEGPLGSIKETEAFFRSGKSSDLILADIRLSDGLSFEALKHAPSSVPILFTTAYDEYAVRAFTVNSIDYLLKPIRQERLEEAIQKFEHVTSKYNQKLLEQNDLLEVLHSLTYPGKKYRTRFLISGNEKLITLQVEDIPTFIH
jgi:two-component system response regulator LytT